MKIMQKYFFICLYIFLGLPTLVFSNPDGSGVSVSLNNPLKMDTLEELLIAILNLIMVLMVPVIVFFIIFAGFKYVTARGNAATIGEATKALTYAVIGAVIILGAVAISQMIKSTVDQFRAEPPAALQFTSPDYV